MDPGIERTFLDEELLKAGRGALTKDCRAGACVACGVCGCGVEMEVLG